MKRDNDNYMESFITQHLDLWTTAQSPKTAGRGNGSSNIRLTGIQKLRELILELAVRGKLVSQDPNDEPAGELLKRIEAEKKSLVKEGKVKKQSLLPIGLKDKSFEIPDNWEWSRLGDVCEIIRGITFPSSEKSKIPESGRVACLRTSNVQNEIEWDDLLYIREEFVKRTDQYLLSNDIVMSMANSRELVGKVAIINRVPESKTTFGGFLGILRPIQLNPNYLMILLKVPTNRDSLIDNASQTTNIANISLAKLYPMCFGIPPLPEQHRIVAKVDELMVLCDQLEQEETARLQAHETLIENLLTSLTNSRDARDFSEVWQRIAVHFDLLFSTEASVDKLKQTILQLAVMGKLVPQDPNDEPASELLKKIAAEKAKMVKEGKIKKQAVLPEITEDEKPFELPKGWEWCRLGEVAEKIGSGSTPRGGSNSYSDSGVIFLRSQNIRNEGLLLDDITFISNQINENMANTIVLPNDILLNITGGSLGRSTIFPRTYEIANVSQHVTIIRLVDKELVQFIYRCIISPYVQYMIWNRQVGANREGLSKKVLELFEFPIPPISEQHRIVSKVDELFALCDSLKERIREVQDVVNVMAGEVGKRFEMWN